MEDSNSSMDDIEENMLAYIEKSHNLFRLGNELNNKIDFFKQEINILQNDFKNELNSFKISNQNLTQKIFRARNNRPSRLSNSSSNELAPKSSNLTQIDSETNLGPISPMSPSIISKKNSTEENPLFTEEEALAKLMEMAKEDGFPIDQLNDNSIQDEELDLTLQPEAHDQDTSAKQIKECSVKIDRIDLHLDSLVNTGSVKISSTTLDFLAEKKILNESLAVDKLCKMNFGKVSNNARKSTTNRRKSLRPKKNAPSVTSFSDTDSDPPDTENSDFTAEKTEDEYRDKLVDMMHSDNFEITEDESMLSSDSEKGATKKGNKWTEEESEHFSDSSKTSVCASDESEVKLIESVAHEYRDSKQTPGYTKQNFDVPNLDLDEASDDEKENKMPGNDESEDEIRPRPTRRSKRLSSEASEEREMSREEDGLEMELSKKSTHLKGILGGELENEISDQNKENLISLENDSASSDEIKPIIKKRKRLKCNSDSESSIKSKLRSRSVVKKESKYDEDDEENSASDDSDIQSVHSSEEESPNKQETRHKLRNIIHDGKLTKETQDAIQTERERKKRVEEKRALEASISRDNENDLYLDVDQVSKKMIVKVDGAISKKLKPHQIEGIKFMWDSCYESCEMIKNGHKGSGCLLAHCMGLGKTFQVIALVHTLLTNRDLTKCKRVLILLPVNVLRNWKNEFRKWTRPCQKQITVYQLPSEKGFSRDLARARLNEIESWHRRGGVLLLSYSMFVRIVNGKNIKPQKLVQGFNRCLLSPGPNLVICDEGHMLKVATSALNKSVSKFDTARRIVLTGTPLQNNLMEYHCMVSFVKPNLLGTIKEFKNRFANPISNGQHKDSTEADVRYMKKRAHILHDVLDGCVQRKDYAVIRNLLRPKKEYVLSIRLSDIQVDLYRTYIQNYGIRTKTSKTKGAELFQDFQNLYRVCSHPWVLKLNEVKVLRKEEKLAEKNFVADFEEEEIVNETEMVLDDDDETISFLTARPKNGTQKPEVNGGGVNSEETASKPVERWWTSLIPNDMEFDINMSGKLVVLEHILKLCAQSGEKLLLFSQSLLSLDLIEVFLEKLSQDKKDRWRKDEDYYRMDGQTDVSKRQSDVDKFNDERNRRGRFFLISTRAGGIGINLVGANRCIIFDACWNPSYDTQSIFRIYRFGQTKDVFIYRFLAQGTMEEKIYQRQVTKQSLSHRVIDEHQIDRHFTSQEINELYNFEPDLWDGKSIVYDIPDDSLLKSLLVDCKKWIAKYHEHDSLLENKLNEGLSEEERKAAWEEYENEKNAQTLHLSHSEPFVHNSFPNIANDQHLMRLYGGILANESNRMSEPFNAHIQAIQREELMRQIEQQNEIMRQHELRNSMQKERLMSIQSNKQPNYLQRMTQMFQNNQNNFNIRIPSGQRNEKEFSDLNIGRHMASHQNLTSILQGIPKSSLNENMSRDYVSQQQAKLLNSRNLSPILSMKKNQKQVNQQPNSNQNQTAPMRPKLTETKPMEP